MLSLNLPTCGQCDKRRWLPSLQLLVSPRPWLELCCLWQVAQAPVLPAYPLYCSVLMLNPSVGLMVVMSSPFSRFTIVVLPALSRPLCPRHGGLQCSAWVVGAAGHGHLACSATYTMRIRISRSLRFSLRIKLSSPIPATLCPTTDVKPFADRRIPAVYRAQLHASTICNVRFRCGTHILRMLRMCNSSGTHTLPNLVSTIAHIRQCDHAQLVAMAATCSSILHSVAWA